MTVAGALLIAAPYRSWPPENTCVVLPPVTHVGAWNPGRRGGVARPGGSDRVFFSPHRLHQESSDPLDDVGDRNDLPLRQAAIAARLFAR